MCFFWPIQFHLFKFYFNTINNTIDTQSQILLDKGRVINKECNIYLSFPPPIITYGVSIGCASTDSLSSYCIPWHRKGGWLECYQTEEEVNALKGDLMTLQREGPLNCYQFFSPSCQNYDFLLETDVINWFFKVRQLWMPIWLLVLRT